MAALTGDILIYTRTPKDEYTGSLANSIHFACRDTGGSFLPLNLNYGVLFAEATISEQNTICEKGIKNPYLFRAGNDLFGIIAVRLAINGTDDEESRGCVLLWTSPDLIDFRCAGLVRLHESVFVESAVCRYNESADNCEITWKDKHGNVYINIINDLTGCNVSNPSAADTFPYTPPVVSMRDISPGNILTTDPQTAQKIYNRLTPPYHVQTIIPDDVTVSSGTDLRTELDKIRAVAVYSDGSTAEKRIVWDYNSIESVSHGEYTINGRAVTPVYPFPLARGYADPVILPRDGRYYFLATNDNKNDIGIYVREADSIEGLFADGYKESVILDADEEKGFIQTFWAPEFHYIGGELYIFFAVGGKQWGPQCHSMKLKKGGRIANPDDWETPVRTKKSDGTFLAEDGITLDMTYFCAEGKSYAVWSYRHGIGTPSDTGSMIYIAQISDTDPSTLISEPVLLTRPVLGWENIQGTINNEGPYPLITDDTVYIAYSGGAARGYTYSIGMMSIPRGSDYLDIAKWKKAAAPVINYLTIDGLYGAGHNSFFRDYDGNIMIAYHAEEEITGHGLACSAMHRVHFRQDGTPVFSMSPGRDLSSDLSDVRMRYKTG